jgi:hypothetical protein
MHALRSLFKCLCLILCFALIAPGFSLAQEDKQSSSSAWIYAGLGIGALIYVLTHHHPHTVSPSPTPSATPTPTPTPTVPPTVEATPNIVTPTPTPVPTPTPCSYRLTDGWFEPTQGPDQDDTTFVEKPAVFTRTGSAPNNISYYAPLYMIENRPTVLEGVDHYRDTNGQMVYVHSRPEVVFKGETNCTKPVDVALNFTLLVHGAHQVIYTTDTLTSIPLGGKAQKTFTKFSVIDHAPLGIPGYSEFTISKADPDYAIVGEIIKHSDGGGTGMRVTVEGIETPTIGPQLIIVPVMLTRASARNSGTMTYMTGLTHLWQRDLYDMVPDIYPLRPHGLPMPQIAPVLDLEDQVLVTLPYNTFFRQADKLVAAVGDRLAAMGSLAGAGRIVVMMQHSDYVDFESDESLGISWNDKVVAIDDTLQTAWKTIAHEVAHTLPHFPWSSAAMISECGLDYHNKGGSVAHGLQTMYASRPGRHLRLEHTIALMQGGPYRYVWITQCTYHNLIGALTQKIDPPLTLVRGFIGRAAHGDVTRFAPSYDLMGTPDLRTSGHGAYALVIRPPNAKPITYRFTPAFRDENGRPRAIVSFGYHIPRPADGSRVDLMGPHGKLASFTRSAHAPSLLVAAPTVTNDGRAVHLQWSASAPGHAILSSVLVSQNSNLMWPQIFESRTSSATIPVGAHTRRLRIKVVVTDGSRSSEKALTVNIPPHSSGGKTQ